MFYFLYDILLLIAFPFIALSVFSRSWRGKRRREGLGERLGFIASAKRVQLAGTGLLWVHAVSVGETMAVRPLLRELKETMPERKLLLSTVTETGQELASTFSEIDQHCYLPFDFSPVVRRVLATVRPSCIVIMETELWPNFIRIARELGIPVVLANGRISDRSFGRYLRFKWLFSRILANFSALCMQSVEDARRITAMGAPEEKVHPVGNLKFDIPVRMVDAVRRSELRDCYRLPQDGTILTAASTHQGEEEIVLDICARLQSAGHGFALVLVPRHPERAAAVSELLAKKGFRYRLRSALTGEDPLLQAGEVLLVDTIGELINLYSAADLVFVGGSLVPTGGHNILEPISCAAPTLFGPYMHNFREVSSLVIAADAGIQVRDAEELYVKLHSLLSEPEQRRVLAENGIRFLHNAGGAVKKHRQIIQRILGQ